MAKDAMETLPPDQLESQLSTIDLLMAMFPDPSELDITPEALACLDRLRASLDGEQAPQPQTTSTTIIPTDLSLAVHIALDAAHSIQLNIHVPFRRARTLSTDEPTEPPPPTLSLRQPTWISRAQLSTLTAALPPDVFEAIDHIRDSGPDLIATATATAASTQTPTSNVSTTSPAADGVGIDSSAKAPLVRVWFYFPSLSTRAKRTDMVSHAPTYGLTGFVLAGKPGVLCVEGTSDSIDAYMRFIKSVSWGDVPSHQKKVSERYRQEGEEGEGASGVVRRFEGMVEITETVGERHGARANRGDMAALRAWLGEKGLEGAFEKVIFS